MQGRNQGHFTTDMRIKYKVDIHTGEQLPAKQFWKSEIATCKVALSDKIVFNAFSDIESRVVLS